MCISLPARIIAISGRRAEVEIENIQRRVLLTFEGANVGDFVLVYGGAALTVLDERAARETQTLIDIGRGGSPKE